jgi:dynein heavy chain
MSEYEIFQIEVMKGYGMNEFKDDLKTCLMQCGNSLKATTFLFADTQIVNEQMVEAINNVLNSGDVPNLYKNEDIDSIMQSCRAACQQAGLTPTKANVFSTYLVRVKACIHVVLAFSPVGEAFRTRLRMFPSLVNCCTIDWFAEWPAEALYSVGKQQMTMEDLKLPNLEGILNLFKTVHQSVEAGSKKMLEVAKRPIYITPTSFLELISSYKKVLELRRVGVGGLKMRLQKGLDALASAAYAVANMQTELTAKQPVLEQTKKQVGEMMVVITEDKAKAAVTKESCTAVETEAKAQAESAKAIKEDAQRDLDEALPALNVAEKALKALKLKDLQEIKALGSPPAGVRLTLEVVCVYFQVKPVKKADPNQPGKKIDDYWEASKTGPLSDPKKLLDDLFEFDRDNIPETVIQKAGPYIEREDFDPAMIKKASIACEAICMWARAMHKYHFVAKAVEPKRKMLADAEASLEVTMGKLNAAQAELKAVEDKIAKLESDYTEAVAKQEQLQKDMDMCVVKLANANKLIEGLGGEKDRWTETVGKLTEEYELLPGDSLVAAGMVSYAGPFTGEYRTDFQNLWLATQDEQGITHKEGATLVSVLGQPVLIQEWAVSGLPNDNLSVENGIIIATARRWPLMIDPQRQANKYIKTYGKVASEGGMSTCKLSDPGLLQTVELGIQFGKWVLLENIGENLDPALEPVLQQQKIRDGTSFVIKLGDKNVAYDDKFRFFMTTTLSNPHYSPETSVKVTLLNFAITPDGLQDQMLGIVVLKEQPEMEEKKTELVKNNAAMNKQLKEIEDDILRLLSADGDILESKELIDTLEYSKKTSAVISKAMEEAAVTEKEIDEVRKSYKDYAYRASLLFFCVSEMQVIDPMYQFSLQWFQQLAMLGIDNAPSGETPDARLQNLISYFTYSIYQSVCRGLFEKHKLLFSFSLCMKIMNGEGRLDANEARFLLAGPTGEVKDGIENPAPEWLSSKSWNEVLSVSQLPAFKGFDSFFASEVSAFQKIYDAPEADLEKLPGPWETKLNAFEKMCYLRTLRPDRITTAVLNFVTEDMGQKFVEPPTFDIAISYEDSTKMSPLIFVLSAGSDPVADMLAFAETKGMGQKLESISLGQGQGPKAAKMIERARETGGWVLLCNCHLSVSWLPELERICEQQNADETDNMYRLWLTSMPTKQFPPLLLQNGVKMTNEPPKGLRANVLGSMMKIDDRMLNDCQKPEAYARLVFGFCFFHAICQDRRKFGPIGWNIPYNFTPEDLVTNRRQLKFFLDNYDAIPYKVLQFLGAKINYGGRVTDKKDKILIETMIKIFICEDVVAKGPDYKFSQGGLFYCPAGTSQDDFLNYLKGLPIMTPPEVFGLHENCEITCAESESMALLEDVLSLSSGSGGGGGGGGTSPEEVMDEMAQDLIGQTPPTFDLFAFEDKFPTKYEESRNTVVKQEAAKYNKLLALLAVQLPLFRRAVKGFVVMTEDLDSVGKALFTNQVPEQWAGVGFLSLKPLTAWYKDLNDRVDFFNLWFQDGHPISFWVSGLFFPQAFFTAVLQNFARKHKFAIDRVDFNVEVVDNFKLDGSDIAEPPEAGCYMRGFFLEGCRWCDKIHALAPSLPKQLFTQLPVVLFKPILDWKPQAGVYPCPAYKVLSRKGTLSTTGHSTNFVRDMALPSKEDPDVWIRAGVAAFLALKY